MVLARAKAIRAAAPHEVATLRPLLDRIGKRLGVSEPVHIQIDISRRGDAYETGAFVAEVNQRSVLTVGLGALAVGLDDPAALEGMLAHELAHIAHGDATMLHRAWHDSESYSRAAAWGRRSIFFGLVTIGLLVWIVIGDQTALPTLALAGALQVLVFNAWIGTPLAKARETLVAVGVEAERLADFAAAEVVGLSHLQRAIVAFSPPGPERTARLQLIESWHDHVFG